MQWKGNIMFGQNDVMYGPKNYEVLELTPFNAVWGNPWTPTLTPPRPLSLAPLPLRPST